ncbi:MAG: hypothetical protein ACM3SW_10165, partial [Actinomycetota bacterium]
MNFRQWGSAIPRTSRAWRAALFQRRTISLLLVLIGIGLLGYVAGQYWGMYRSQQKLETEWQHQAALASLPGAPKLTADDL